MQRRRTGARPLLAAMAVMSSLICSTGAFLLRHPPLQPPRWVVVAAMDSGMGGAFVCMGGPCCRIQSLTGQSILRYVLTLDWTIQAWPRPEYHRAITVDSINAATTAAHHNRGSRSRRRWRSGGAAAVIPADSSRQRHRRCRRRSLSNGPTPRAGDTGNGASVAPGRQGPRVAACGVRGRVRGSSCGVRVG